MARVAQAGRMRVDGGDGAGVGLDLDGAIAAEVRSSSPICSGSVAARPSGAAPGQALDQATGRAASARLQDREPIPEQRYNAPRSSRPGRHREQVMRIAVISDVHANLPGLGDNPTLQAGEFNGAGRDPDLQESRTLVRPKAPARPGQDHLNRSAE